MPSGAYQPTGRSRTKELRRRLQSRYIKKPAKVAAAARTHNTLHAAVQFGDGAWRSLEAPPKLAVAQRPPKSDVGGTGPPQKQNKVAVAGELAPVTRRRKIWTRPLWTFLDDVGAPPPPAARKASSLNQSVRWVGTLNERTVRNPFDQKSEGAFGGILRPPDGRGKRWLPLLATT
ncbi:hypothetical protein AXG93_115s1190 [Marchantia polymorpha subsp. ruderalis]|uniref:Uncharacterized protein n=1 Tax=Marchantia polymorpha subsp. ruderalis TaxID=1480154 RepID=A0A176W5V7_MARPO|nr:hypothetical protein AXG93_115s1190 [Marchantia polymorpha subsp. ruderalis]